MSQTLTLDPLRRAGNSFGVKPVGYSKNEKTQEMPLLGEVRVLGLDSARTNVEETSFFKS